MSSQKNAKLQQNTQLLNLSLTNLETILPIWFNYQKINNKNIPSSGLCPCIWLCLCLGTWELLFSSGKSGAMALPWTRQRDTRDKYARSLLLFPLKGGVPKGWVELLLSLCFYNRLLLPIMDGRAELKDRTPLPCPNHFHKDHQNLRITNGPFQFLPSLPFCSIWGSPPCLSCLARSLFSAGLINVSLPRILPQLPFLLGVMFTSEASPNRCGSLGFSLCLSFINCQLTVFTWIFIHSFTHLLIHLIIWGCLLARAGWGISRI